jgi:hypothetical protein|tara:strand:+ start:1397 stop:1576 length:180 start_codon:yes stop_codon:yes gene_type:complete
MKVDRYYDPYEDLEKKCLNEIEQIAKSLGGTMQKISKRDSMGRSSKVIQIEYEINEGNY